MHIPILWEDDDILAVNKPSQLLVHRTGISEDKVFLLQLLRDQVGYHVHPIHRIDRATSGIVLFAKNRDIASALGIELQEGRIEKFYTAFVRGFMPNQNGSIERDIKDSDTAVVQSATTFYKVLQTSVLPVAISRYPTSRFSHLLLKIETGRRHQIRRHLSHLRHPIIGDTRYGDLKYNHYFRDKLSVDRMLLHACQVSFRHPSTTQFIQITSSPNFDIRWRLFKDLFIHFSIYRS